MSWSASFDYENGSPVEETVSESNVSPDYHNDQYEEALSAAWGIIDSGVLGDPKGKYRITFSGHGNPGHVPLAGWSNDSVSFSIYQL
jgi:hypothetical protein